MHPKFAVAALVLVVAHDISTQIKAQKLNHDYRESLKNFIEAAAEVDAANQAQIEYLMHVLNKHEIPADTFDLIALNYYVS